MVTALITDVRQIMRNGLHRFLLCQRWYLCAWNTASCLPAPGLHLLMIQAVFSASGDNVLSALWEISVFRSDSLDLFRTSPPSYFYLCSPSKNFSFSSLLSSHISPYLPSTFSPIHTISPVFLVFFPLRGSQRRVRAPISFLHTLLTLRLSPPSVFHPYQHQVNSPLP